MVPKKFIDIRLRRLREILTARSIDGLVLIEDESRGWENLFYLSGFKGSSALAVITCGEALLAVDSRYSEQAREQSSLRVCDMRPRESQTDTVKRLITAMNLRRAAFDGAGLSAQTYMRLSAAGGEWIDVSHELALLRRHKDEWEISCIRKAAQIAGEAYTETLSLIRPGMTELEFAKLLELAIARRGGEGVWHNASMIVASGSRSAMPHGVAGIRAMEYGDQVTVDYGAIYGAYMSDITRNFSLGMPKDAESLEIHEILLKAHRDAAALLRPGIAARDVHAAAQNVIADAGYASYFGHALGHGIGLEIHEMPHLSPRSAEILEPGDVVTVEPGIYIPERGGLRLEDDYLIVKDGAVRLTESLPQEYVHLHV